MIFNMGSGGENLTKEITEQKGLIDSIRKLYTKLNWTQYMSNRPANIYDAVEFDGGIYVTSDSALFKWSGEWTSVSTLEVSGEGASLIVYNNEIHLIGGIDSHYRHMKWNGSEWISVSTLPTSGQRCNAVVYEGKIHIFTQVSGSYVQHSHFSWDGTSWTEEIPFEEDSEFDVVVHNGKLYAITSNIYVYRDNQEWDEYLNTPEGYRNACVFDGELFVTTESEIYMMMDEHWVNVGESPLTVDDSVQMFTVGGQLMLLGTSGHFGGRFYEL